MRKAPRVTVLGYASLDYSMSVSLPPLAGRTSLVTRRLSDPWPDCGGAARFVGPLARAGADVSVISWVGTDAAGQQWIASVTGTGASLIEGCEIPGASPVSYLIHSGSDLPACVFDPGVSSGPEVELNSAMDAAINVSDWCLCSVAPSSAIRAMVERMPSTCRLAWVVKADSDAFPVDLRRRLWERSSLIVLGEAEEEFLAEAGLDVDAVHSQLGGPIIVKTAGSGSITWTHTGSHGTVAVEPIDSPVNTVGAGDVFAGALLASLIASEPPPASEQLPAMVADAAQAARQFLIDRSMSWS